MDDIRKLMLTRLSDIKDVMLSPRAVEIVMWLQGSEKSSANLAEKYNISVQNASQQLNNLYKKGYLNRTEQIEPTGGTIYFYRSKYETQP